MTLFSLIKRHCKVYFKDKSMFFTSLITPMILLVLYVTFLAKVYRDAFTGATPEGFELSEKLINGTVAAQLMSSLLAVSCVTVAFCSNLTMVMDKVTGARRDLTVSPVKSMTLSMSYFFASTIATLIVLYTAFAACLLYVGRAGWYFTSADIMLIILDIFLLVLFGTSLSSLIHCFLSTSGQAQAVGTIISSCYGFICGAYMPISNFGTGLQRVVSFFPGTYGTSLMRNHCMRGCFDAMADAGVPAEVMDAVMASVDCKLNFFDNEVSVPAMFVIVVITVLVLTAAYVAVSAHSAKKNIG